MSAWGRRLACLFVFVLLATAARNSSASFLDTYGFNPRALGMGGAHAAVTDDFTALYYNPAALTATENAVWGFGLMLSAPSLDLDFARPDPAVAGLEPPNANAFTFGGLFPLGGEAVRNRVALAFALVIPTRSLLNGQALDPVTPHWYMFQALPERLVAMLGIGVLPFEWLSIGASAQFLAGVSGQLDYELDLVAGRFTRKNVTFDIEPVLSPILGIEVRPLDGLRVGFSYRGAISSQVDLPVVLELTGLATLDVTTQFDVHYTPHELTWGASYMVPVIDLLTTVDVTFSMWSHAPDPSALAAINVTGELIEGGGLGEALDAPAPGQERRVDLGFRDVIVPRLGVERTFGIFTARGGYSVRPSPAPLQTSGTNYIDGTTHHVSLGASLRVEDPLEWLANPITFDVSGSLLFLPSRQHQKTDPNDAIGDIAASGSIFVFGAAFRYAYGEGKIDASNATEPTAPPEELAE